MCREALEMNRRVLPPDHPDIIFGAAALSNVLRHLNRLSEAENLARESLEMSVRKLGQVHARTKEAEGALGLALAAQRRWKDAEPLLLSYARALEAKAGVEGDFGEVAAQIADMYTAWEKTDKAAEWRAELSKPVAQGPAK